MTDKIIDFLAKKREHVGVEEYDMDFEMKELVEELVCYAIETSIIEKSLDLEQLDDLVTKIVFNEKFITEILDLVLSKVKEELEKHD